MARVSWLLAAVTLLASPTIAKPFPTTPSLCSGQACEEFKIYDEEQRAKIIRDLESHFIKNVGAAKIESCDAIVAEPFGRGFSGYGAQCTISIGQKKLAWVICDDDGAGWFGAVTTREFKKTDAYIVNFMHENCIGG